MIEWAEFDRLEPFGMLEQSLPLWTILSNLGAFGGKYIPPDQLYPPLAVLYGKSSKHKMGINDSKAQFKAVSRVEK